MYSAWLLVFLLTMAFSSHSSSSSKSYKRLRLSNTTKPSHDRADVDAFDTVYAREGTRIMHGTLTSETPRSPQKGRAAWVAPSWSLDIEEDTEMGLLDDGWVDVEGGGEDENGPLPRPTDTHKVKKKKKHWVCIF
jgi:hypothetical protein